MKKISAFISILFLFIANGQAQITGTGTVSLIAIGTAATENFDALSNTAGSTTNTTLPTGWYISESGGGARDNDQYAVDAGGSTTGDTYSYGAAASTERALGELRSGTLIPFFGASFTNNTGTTITSLDIAYNGEEWRLGSTGRAIGDQLNFELSTNATDILTGTFTNFASLNFPTPDNVTVGAKNGNAAADRTSLSASITGLSIAAGATFWIRFTDVDATGADDGLAIDDFSITPQAGVVAIHGVNLTAIKNNTGTTLNWTTQQEVNSSYFAVQRSGDGNIWENIAQVPAAGNSSTMLHYSFTDAHPLRGTNLYRLQMVSMDHGISYSDNRRVNFDTDNPYGVYPNPAKNIIWVTGSGTNITTDVQVINAAGMPVIQKQMLTGDQPVSLNVETLRPGVYYVRIVTPGGTPSLVSFVKQ